MRNRFWFIVFLVIIWCGFNNSFKIPYLVFGSLVSFFIVYVVLPKKVAFKIHIIQLIVLMLYTAWELTLSSLEVAWDILTPRSRSQPKIIKVPLECREPLQMSCLACLISLTPGTLVVDIDEENNLLVIHIMFSQHEKHITDFIKQTLEPKIIKVFQND